MYRNDLRGNKNYFELAGCSTESRVRVTEGKITVLGRNPGEIDFEFESARGSS